MGEYVGRVVDAQNGSKVLVHFLDSKEPENIAKSKLRNAGTIGSSYDHGGISYKLLKFVDTFVHTQRKKILTEDASDRAAAGECASFTGGTDPGPCIMNAKR